jgi:pimeloyl-ACP methyl ester carboxylesterase
MPAGTIPGSAAAGGAGARMERQLLFVQGGGAGAHDEWDARLVESLRRALGPGWEVRYPRMPREADPDFAGWSAALRAELARLDDGAIVVGHSVGGTILINALAEQPPALALGAIILVAAPFVGEGGWPGGEGQDQREIGGKLPRGVPVYLFHGLADTTVPPSHAELYARAIPRARLCLLPGRDHQLGDDLREIAAAIRALAATA